MATKDFSNKQEKLVASYLGWQVVAGSGAAACHPGDIRGDDWLGECKTHEVPGKPIFFSKSVWEKICEEAIKERRSPVLFTDDGSQTVEKTWCIFKSVMLDEDWSIKMLPASVRTNINISVEKLENLYKDAYDARVCYIAELGKSKVAILPLVIFEEMFR